MTSIDKIKLKTNNNWETLLDLIYPVGSFYMSSQTTSPAQLFGGTWTQITDQYLYAGSSFTNGGTSTFNFTLATTNLPSHTHTIAHTHTLNGHTHGMGHRHSFTKVKSINNTTLTAAQSGLPSHSHALKIYIQNASGSNATHYGLTWSDPNGVTKPQMITIAANNAATAGNDGIVTTSANASSGHSHGITTETGYTNNSINTANTNARTSTDGNSNNTSAASTNNSGSTGDGTAVTYKPYYKSIIVWYRTA